MTITDLKAAWFDLQCEKERLRHRFEEIEGQQRQIAGRIHELATAEAQPTKRVSERRRQ